MTMMMVAKTTAGRRRVTSRAQLGPDESNEFGMKVAKKLGVDEAILITVIANEQMVRFANNSLTVTKNINESGQIVYLAKGGKRIIGSSSNPEKASLQRFIELLYKSMMNLPKDPGYVPLPADRPALQGRGPLTTRGWSRRRGCSQVTCARRSRRRKRRGRSGPPGASRPG